MILIMILESSGSSCPFVLHKCSSAPPSPLDVGCKLLISMEARFDTAGEAPAPHDLTPDRAGRFGRLMSYGTCAALQRLYRWVG